MWLVGQTFIGLIFVLLMQLCKLFSVIVIRSVTTVLRVVMCFKETLSCRQRKANEVRVQNKKFNATKKANRGKVTDYWWTWHALDILTVCQRSLSFGWIVALNQAWFAPYYCICAWTQLLCLFEFGSLLQWHLYCAIIERIQISNSFFGSQ